jgi:signal transduction histidine kinase
VRTGHGSRIVVAENVERQEELLEVLSGGLRSALAASLLAALLAGLWMARRNQARLDKINSDLGKVAHGDLGARINLPDRQDDLSLLANRIDATIEHLEQVMEQMRVQSSNIAHDLRTPLARLRAQVETQYLALVEDGTAVSPDGLETALAQIDRIVGTFDALLRIARLDSGARRASFQSVDLKEVMLIVEEACGPVIEDAGQDLKVTVVEPAMVHGDRDLLVQLLANLIQNAMRYGPQGQSISLSLHGRQISITDEGPGIPFEAREKVLEPLFQMEDARQGEGFGLGLSLVRAIADLHGATLSLTDGPGSCGLCATLRFPELTDL